MVLKQREESFRKQNLLQKSNKKYTRASSYRCAGIDIVSNSSYRHKKQLTDFEESRNGTDASSQFSNNSKTDFLNISINSDMPRNELHSLSRDFTLDQLGLVDALCRTQQNKKGHKLQQERQQVLQEVEEEEKSDQVLISKKDLLWLKTQVELEKIEFYRL